MNNRITIVTAFFDIGRENWTVENGHPKYLFRTPETYIEYFKKIASLDNEMIIFTSEKYAKNIEDIRKGKPTRVIIFDYEKKLRNTRKRIEKIQSSASFRSKVSDKQLINPEYWSADYTLVTNLKSYFVTKAIDSGYVSNNQVAWMDFGYCRDNESLNNVSEWIYDFEKGKVHIFTLKKIPTLTFNMVLDAIYNNNVFIIGGVTISDKNTWYAFNKLIYDTQRELMKMNIVDDDQGIYLFSFLKNKNIFKVHSLGKNKWRTLFYTYDISSKINIIKKIKKILGIL